ncbi:hypothetical protein M0R45_019921 [Rubus argutus]|uniref:ADP-ribosyl cyclase/cyclic ADP-ribose hydrolase n=1 Tax=Rubus argutus TaxID=59490 RepID=A0AAW1X9A1_RUBAR
MVKIEETSSSSTHPWENHVFLSFRGEDTRNNFTGHLCTALRQKGITTFMDDELKRGEEISTALVRAIEQSMISIIVFSENYASSKWCLDELVMILECKKSNIQQMVRPIFYKVDPSDIRNHRKSFGNALAEHERKFKGDLDKVWKWKKALSEAANMSGWTLPDMHHSESKLIGEIVEEISKQVIERTYLEVAKYPVGIEPRVQYVKELLSVEGREEVRMVGIWGTGGIGKTTIAKAVYNSISHNFDGSYFLENVRENLIRSSRGLAKLQQTLLFEILGGKKVKVTNASRGITMIKEFLHCKRVLLVLDDVNHPDQLNSLAGESDWFGTGSRIIITTRDKKLLTAHNVNLIYKVSKLDNHEALELFCLNAFKRNEPLVDYVELTKRAIGYARGLPLALTVLGSHLYGGNLHTWTTSLDGFKSPEIQEILKVSYDALDVIMKQIFLDIACFFKGERTDYVIQVLKGCDHNPEYGIKVLIEKALVNIDRHGCIWMHDLLEEMGKDIVYQESPNDPGERSRLWFHDDVYHVLTENTGTSTITGIKVELPTGSDVICLSGTTFSQMRNLRLFIHRAGCFSRVHDYLPNSLRVVDWPDYPFQSLSSNFIPKNLALLHMPRSRITRIGEEFKSLKNLTSINLSECKYLTKVSDLSGIPNLQTLDLQGCKNLVEVHYSVGFLDKLESINLGGCSTLVIVPTTVSWNSLRNLLLFNCTRLESFIETVNKMQSIEKLSLFGSGIKGLPSWIGYLTSLRELNVSGTPLKKLPLSIGGLTSLRRLYLSRTLITELPSSIGDLTSLAHLGLSGTRIIKLPSLIGDLASLVILDLSHSPIKELPSSIGDLISLERLDLSHSPIEELPLSIGGLTSLIELDVSETLITELPSSIGDLTSLERLDLSHSPIKELSSSIGGLTSLGKLDVSNCLIKELPSSIGGLTSLGELYVYKTLITELPSSIGDLTSLTDLRLSETLIIKLPSSIGDLASLTKLDVSESSIKELPSSIGYLTSLRKLDVSGTLIEELPSSIASLIYLKYLFVRRCENLINVPQSIYGGLRRLEYLNLSWCRKLVTFPNRPVSSLVSSSAESFSLMLPTTSYISHDNCASLLFPKLRRLYFQGCKLSSVFDFLSNLDCVSTLDLVDLSYSSFDSLPACISKFHKLEFINLSGCKWLRDISTLWNKFELRDVAVSRLMDMSNCNRLGIDVVSKMAKVLLNQVVDGNSCMTFEWHIKLPSHPGWKVPKWFHYRKMDVYEFLIEIPRSLIWERKGLVVCVIFEITQFLSETSMQVMMDEQEISSIWCRSFPSKISGYYLYLQYIGLDNLWKQQVNKKSDQSLPHIFQVSAYMSSGETLLLKSCGFHLANMLGNDDDDVVEEDKKDKEGENYDVDDDDARGEDLAKQTNIGRATLAFLRCFGITCL